MRLFCHLRSFLTCQLHIPTAIKTRKIYKLEFHWFEKCEYYLWLRIITSLTEIFFASTKKFIKNEPYYVVEGASDTVLLTTAANAYPEDYNREDNNERVIISKTIQIE